MKSQALICNYEAQAKQSPNEHSLIQVPRRRLSRIEQFNESVNRKLRSVFSTVDWVQVSHYMDRLS